MDTNLLAASAAFIALACTGVGVWVALRERLVRAETKIEALESAAVDHKSDLKELRDWLENQFAVVRRDISRKMDRDK